MKKIAALVIVSLIIAGISVLMLYKPCTEISGNQAEPVSPSLTSDAPEAPGAPATMQASTPAQNAGDPTQLPPAQAPSAQSAAPAQNTAPPAPATQAAIVSAPSAATAANIPSPTPAAQAGTNTVQEGAAQASIGLAAFEKASKENQYLFLFCSDNDSPATLEARNAFESALGRLTEGVQWAYMDKNQPSESAALAQFRLSRAPMPIIVAIAPNGAITGAHYGDKLKEPNLQESMAGQAEQQCMKALQSGKLVFACMQNATTKSNDIAMQGVNDFKADTRFAEATEIVSLDPANEADQRFLTKLGIQPTMEEATTAFLAPPRSLVKTFTGATDKDALVAAIMAASKGGCGGGKCAPGACGPKVAKGNPQQ